VTVITLSRELGSQGDRIATLVAERLGLGLVDRERLHRAARAAGVSEAALHELELSAEQTLVSRILRSLHSVPPTPTEKRELRSVVAPLTSPLGGIFSPSLPPASIAIAELVKMLNQVIEKRAREGDVLILGQGSQVLLRGQPGVLHVRVFSPRGQRIATLQAREGLSKTAALRKVRACDRQRGEYLRRFHNARWNDPSMYHLLINTALIPQAAAVELIVTASGALAEEKP
jgi:cytidylate kinase